MTKFLGMTLDFIALILAAIGIYFGLDNLLLFPYSLFWFNAIIIVFFMFASKEFCLKNHKARSKVWSVYDFISDNAFVALCFYLNWTVLGVFLLVMIILKAAKYEVLEQACKQGDKNANN